MALFTQFNKEFVHFTVLDEDQFDRKKYHKLADLYDEENPDKVFNLRGLFIGTKSELPDVPESPIAATDNFYVNLPVHQLEDVKAIRANKAAVSAMNKGRAGFKIRKYTSVYNTECYAVEWIDK